MPKIKRLSLVQILTNYLEGRPNKWIHGGRLEKVSQSWGFEAETGKRRLREMTQKGHERYDRRIKESYVKGQVLYLLKK